MSYNGSDDSDGEGFIPNKMIIKQKETSDLKEQHHFEHFQPHYLIGETVIKKEPPECNLPISTIQREPFQITVGTSSDTKGDLPTASSLYLSPSYQLIYSRFKKPFGEGQKSTFINQIIIKSIGRSQHFRSLKNWRCDNNSTYEPSENLKFDSKFEGGNLLCAFQSIFQQDTYVLFMQNDTNTYGYNQWFYFSIRYARPHKKYTFRIVNFKKNYSFFKKGMQPYLFSLEKSRLNGCGWYMGGTGFEYYRSNFAEKQSGNYYTLSFQMQFKYANDFVMISSSLPYSYSKLMQQIEAYQAIAIERSVELQVKSVAKTLGGNQVPYIKIVKKSPQKKKIILITARQHSGQTWSSYLMDELLKGIVKQQDSYYQWLLQSFDFHVFPMVNVDGVIYGNFRCDLAGYDLNRCWKDPSPILQPHIYRIRQAIHQLTEHFSLHLYLDLHTHSKEHGVFAFSCVQSQQCRRLPFIISQLTPLFRYPVCTFGISTQKKTTARSEIFDISDNINTITIELSAFGYRHPTSNGLVPFTIANITAVAQSIANSLYYYNHEQIKIVPINSYIEDSKFLHINLPIQENTNGEVSGSDSEPQIDAIEQSIKVKKILKDLRTMDLKIKKSKPRVKKLKTQMNLASSPEPFDIDPVQISPVNRYRAVTEFSKQKRGMQPDNLSRRLLSSTCVPQRTAHSYKKIFKTTKLASPGLIDANLDSPIQIKFANPPKPLNLIQFSLKKLPIYNFEKNTHNNPVGIEKVDKSHISILSFSKNSPEKEEKGIKNGMTTYYRTKRQGNVSATSTSNKNVKDPFQFLCIMSQSKKLEQIQKIKERKQLNQHNLNNIINKTKVGPIKHSTVLQRYTKNRKPQNSEVLSKIWIRNFHRYSKSLEDQMDQ